jgi:hypothetical protein
MSGGLLLHHAQAKVLQQEDVFVASIKASINSRCVALLYSKALLSQHKTGAEKFSENRKKCQHIAHQN